jgi:cytochrome c-type biogenesis protein CcmH/NrfG
VLGESAVNRLGYYWLYRRQDLSIAIAVFEINTRFAPESANAWDSLGEALMVAGRNEEAISCYRRSLELDPDNSNAARMIAKIEDRPD